MNQNINGSKNNLIFQIDNPLYYDNPNIIEMNNNMNNFNNQFFMNNQMQMMQNIQMNQMDQMAMPNMVNQNNAINFVNQNQKILVDKIIDFYKKSGRIYMNYNEKNQIKKLLDNLNTNCPLLKEANDISDPLPYVNEKKKLIKFINHDFKIFNVKVPISIDKKTLYNIASLFKS